MNKYERMIKDLSEGRETTIKAFGNSMTPILSSGVELTFKATNDYQVGDVVFSKVGGRFIDAHKITKIDQGRYLISNNKGRDNGWTRNVFGRVVKADGKPFGRTV